MMRLLAIPPWRRLRLRYTWIMVLLTATLAGCTTALPKFPEKAEGTEKAYVNIRYHGFDRNYLVHLPTGYDAAKPLPMVVVLHGAFGTARIMERNSGFSNLADEKHFIAVYPDGVGLFGNFQTWNAGHCCGPAAEKNIDDVEFLTTVITDACSRLAVDQKRIYMVGFSNGGMMTYRFAAEKGDLLAAIAPVAGSAGGRPNRGAPEWGIPEPVKALPVIAIHGLADESVPYNGGPVAEKGNVREYWSIIRSLDVWAARDGCTAPPAVREERQGKVFFLTYKNCKNNNKVELYALRGWPHLWPGAHYTDDLERQDPLYGFDAARVIWDFFEASHH